MHVKVCEFLRLVAPYASLFHVRDEAGFYETRSKERLLKLNRHTGWLTGVIREGRGEGHVGEGMLLITRDGGASWRRNTRILAGRGEFTWGPQGTRDTWTEVGPIKQVLLYAWHTGDEPRVDGILATSTGVAMLPRAGGRAARALSFMCHVFMCHVHTPATGLPPFPSSPPAASLLVPSLTPRAFGLLVIGPLA